MKLSSLEGYDHFRFYVDNRELIELDGNIDWREVQYLAAESGTHTFKWCYEKGGSPNYDFRAGVLDRVWVDELRISPYQLISPSSALDLIDSSTAVTFSGDANWFGQSETTKDGTDALQSGAIGENQNSCFEVSVNAPSLIDFYWKLSSQSDSDDLFFYIDDRIEGSISSRVDWQQGLYVIEGSGSHSLKWCYEKGASQSALSAQAWVDELNIRSFAPIHPGLALDLNQSLSFSGDADWFGQSQVTHDGVDALQSGSIAQNQESCFAGTVAGPLKLTYYWKFLSYSASKRLLFKIDGAEKDILTEEQDWEQKSYILEESKDYNLEWCYREGSASGLSGTAWVDEVELSYFSPIDLPEALDITSTVTPLGDAQWFGQAAITNDNTDALQSGAIADSQESCFETSISGANNIRFYWKVSSQNDHDHLNFYVDDALKERISGELDWEEFIYLVTGSGSHVLKWCYQKDGGDSSGNDRAWVDELRISPLSTVTLAQALDTTNTITSPSGSSSSSWFGQALVSRDGSDALQSGAAALNQRSCFSTQFTVAVNERLIIEFDWKIDANGSNALAFYLNANRIARIQGKQDWDLHREVIENTGLHSLEWCYEKNAESAIDQDRAWLDRLGLTLINTSNSQEADLEAALDDNSLDFTLSGDRNWFSQTRITNDGVDALQSGGIEHGQRSCFSTTLAAASSVRYLGFYWRTSSEENYDFLRFYVNGGETGRISGESGWLRGGTVLESSRSYTLEWCYTKDGSETEGEDATWVDQLQMASLPSPRAALGITDPSQSLRFFGDKDWFAQETVSRDSTGALQSGAIGDDQRSCVESDLSGAADISFYWRVSSERRWDYLRFYVDGLFVSDIHGISDWAEYSYTINSPGSHTVGWCYEKDRSISRGSDSGWLDQLVITPR